MSAHETTTAPVETPIETTPAVAEPVVAKPEETTATAPAHETTETAAPVAPVSAETPVTDGEAHVAEPATETVAATEKTTAAEPAKAIESGVLGYKAPGLIKSFKFSKKHFWLSDESIPTTKLNSYLRGEKPEVAHPTAAYASQTGTGLLLFTKQGEEKSSPAGVLNLSEASDLEKQTPHEFSFKLHGHKHTFKAANDTERNGWYIAIEKSIADAKATKDEVVGSEGYKEALAQLSKPAVVAGGAAPAVAGARKSVEVPKADDTRVGSSSSSDEEEAAKKKEQSRSASRAKRSSIFGNLLNKKDEHETRKEIKKEEKEEAKEEKKEDEELKAAAPVEGTEPTLAPLDAEGTASRAIDAPVEETEPAAATETAPVTDATKDEARPKAAKRSSVFGTFFEKVRSPTHEKKQSEVAPIVPPKDTVVSAEPPVLPEPTTETTIESSAPAASAAPVEAAAPVTEETAPKTDGLASPQRKESFFGGMINKVRAKSPANIDRSPAHKTEDAPAVPPKSADAAPAVGEPAATVPASESAIADEPVADATVKATTPKESRRKSYFGAPGNKISNIFRKPSQAVRGNKDSKKENVTPATEEGVTSTEAPAITTSEPLAHGSPAAAAEETKVEEVQPVSNVGAEGVTEGHEHKSTPVVSTAA